MLRRQQNEDGILRERDRVEPLPAPRAEEADVDAPLLYPALNLVNAPLENIYRNLRMVHAEGAYDARHPVIGDARIAADAHRACAHAVDLRRRLAEALVPPRYLAHNRQQPRARVREAHAVLLAYQQMKAALLLDLPHDEAHARLRIAERERRLRNAPRLRRLQKNHAALSVHFRASHS